MLQPKKINKTDFCENDYTIKIPFLPTHITKKGKENYDAFYSLSQTKITSNNYDSWRNKFDEFLEFQIVEDCTMLINFYKKIYNSQQAEVIRNKILYFRVMKNIFFNGIIFPPRPVPYSRPSLRNTKQKGRI